MAPQRLQRGEVVRIGGNSFLIVPDTAVYLFVPHGMVLWELTDGQNTCDDLINHVMRANESGLEAADLVFGWFMESRSHGLVDLHPIEQL